jgi:hypothetical protein
MQSNITNFVFKLLFYQVIKLLIIDEIIFNRRKHKIITLNDGKHYKISNTSTIFIINIHEFNLLKNKIV